MSIARSLTFVLIATVGCVADLWTKDWVFNWRGMPQGNNIYWLWEGYVGIQTALNRGALFGFGEGWGIVFCTLSIAAAVAIVYWVFVRRALFDTVLTVSLASILGGILGNLYDRMGLWNPPGEATGPQNAVRDWILLRYGTFTWPNFNIADCMLVVGALILMWHAWRQSPHESHATQPSKYSPS